jgi:hypothetical protein
VTHPAETVLLRWWRLGSVERRVVWRAARGLFRARVERGRTSLRQQIFHLAAAGRLRPLLVAGPAPGAPEPDRIAWIVEATASRLPWRTTCLERAFVSAALIVEAGESCELVLGVSTTGGAFDAHAWLKGSDGVIGPPPLRPYVPAVCWQLTSRT